MKTEVRLPEIGSSEREAAETAALSRGRELLREYEGCICDALHALREELRSELVDARADETRLRAAITYEREYSQALSDHVEQCWATAILR